MSKLEVGDYQAEYADGTRSSAVFERKSLGDLFGTMTSGYARFKRELIRAANLKVNLVLIVENTISEVKEGYAHSEFKGESMLKKLGTMWFKHRMPTVFCNGRNEMVEYITQYFMAEGFQKLREGL